MEFWTIEVHDGQFSASWWAQSHREALVEAAITHRAQDWQWLSRDWGVVFEIGFADEADWLRFRSTPAVQAALDAAPDPVNGVHTYRGRGGSSGVGEPLRPRPRAGAGAAALPEPPPELHAYSLAWLDPVPGLYVAEHDQTGPSTFDASHDCWWSAPDGGLVRSARGDIAPVEDR